ncbi:uncharacterized protein LOC142977245 [Anticarsia gemmatalis]|uniref:uncharacterized protein LOC142977245 n=1 Tax=Anticarsia gemmatalis TaxID=129554 RepID=UPI003F75AA40
MDPEEITRTRCFCCLPLRSIWFVWSCYKLMLASFVTLGLSASLDLFTTSRMYDHHIIILAMILSVVMVDSALHVAILIQYHKFQENLKLWKAYYLYSFVIWVLMATLGSTCPGLLITASSFSLFDSIIIIINLAAVYIYLFYQTYLLIRTRGKIRAFIDFKRRDRNISYCILEYKEPFEVKEIADNQDEQVKETAHKDETSPEAMEEISLE